MVFTVQSVQLNVALSKSGKTYVKLTFEFLLVSFEVARGLTSEVTTPAVSYYCNPVNRDDDYPTLVMIPIQRIKSKNR